MFNDPKGLVGPPNMSTRKGRRHWRKVCRIAAKKAAKAAAYLRRNPAPLPCWLCLDKAKQWCVEC